MSHRCDGRSRRRLLVATDIWVDSAQPRIPSRDIRAFRGLERHFDVSWTFIATDANPGDHPLPEHAVVHFVPSVRSKWHLFALLPKYTKIMAHAMRANDIVLALSPMFTTLPALVGARVRGRPSILLILAPLSAIDFFRRRFVRRTVSMILNLEVLLSTETLVLSSHLADSILPPLRKRVDVFTFSSVGNEDFAPVTHPSPYTPVELLCVGRLVSYKRFDIAIEAVSRLRREGVDATLTVVGDGADRPRLERLARELGVAESVSFTGWTDDPEQLRGYYRRAFALLLPSEIEAFGMVVLEAMAAGTPVLRTAPTGGLDVLEPDVDVVIADPNTPEAYVEAVTRLHSDTEWYVRIARAAQKKVSSLTRETWHRSLCERADRLIRK